MDASNEFLSRIYWREKETLAEGASDDRFLGKKRLASQLIEMVVKRQRKTRAGCSLRIPECVALHKNGRDSVKVSLRTISTTKPWHVIKDAFKSVALS